MESALIDEKGYLIHSIMWHESSNKICVLFPYVYVKQACKIAGMKKPSRLGYGSIQLAKPGTVISVSLLAPM